MEPSHLIDMGRSRHRSEHRINNRLPIRTPPKPNRIPIMDMTPTAPPAQVNFPLLLLSGTKVKREFWECKIPYIEKDKFLEEYPQIPWPSIKDGFIINVVAEFDDKAVVEMFLLGYRIKVKQEWLRGPV